MSNITRSDVAWGTGIACVIATLGLYLVIDNLVNVTAKAVADATKIGTRAAGVIAKGYVPPAKFTDTASMVARERKTDKSVAGPWSDDEEAGDIVSASIDIEDKNTSTHMIARLQ